MADHGFIDKRNAELRRLPDWAIVRGAYVASADNIADGTTLVGLSRTKKSHEGIGRRKSITTLFAATVDQAYLDEICELEALEYLWLGWPVTAADFSGLERLERLTYLKLDSPRNVTDFGPIARLPALTHLFVENAKHMNSLDWLSPLTNQLTSLGIEGSLWASQKVPGLNPLSGFNFEALFMTSVRLADNDLTPLAACPNLSYLDCARFAPKQRFDELKALRPDITCSWFERYDT
ncbi:hypothetical protein [Altererythrobacter sp. Root672]|uniref:hypothetical protein n=1 Tax=Altererythrobacter sp. Root672 TaxID=1736584 RepID=UPI0006FC9DA6|nr:hypothetical protein [Altererythrobacter sp. Root672]KRA79387.1 hypothetical protein ASD76_17590 [Altererythrobacter sp. Root672]